MRFKTRRILPAIVVIGAIAAGGAAYTAGSGFGSVPTASYAGTTINGAAATGLVFTYSKDGSLIQTATFTLAAPNGDDYTASTTYDIQAGFDTADTSASAGPGASALQASNQNTAALNKCTAAAGTSPDYTVVCDYTGGTGIGGIPVGDTTPNPGHDPNTTLAGSGADQFNVLVTTIVNNS